MKVILGDNPFFDINHKTGGSDRGFQKESMENVISEFLLSRPCILMLSDHLEFRPQLLELFEKFQKDSFSLALISPLPHTVNDLVANGGYKALLKVLSAKTVFFLAVGLILKLLRFQLVSELFIKVAIKSFVKQQLRPYLKSNILVSHFGLHNVFTDMLLASRNLTILNSYIDALNELNITPILLTQNIASLIELDRLQDCVICGSVNPSGYMMPPGRYITEEVLTQRARSHEIWAMQILAGGTTNLQDSLNYIKRLNLNCIVYATSKPERINELFEVIE